MANLTMIEFRQKIDKWSRRHPRLVKTAMNRGARRMLSELKRRYNAKLKKRTGNLFASLQVIRNVIRRGNVSTQVGVGVAGGKSQIYKAVTHELGATRTFKRGPAAGKSFTIPKRSFVAPARRAVMGEVRQMILDSLINGWKHGEIQGH